MPDIPINLIFEDALSEAVLLKLVRCSRQKYSVGFSYNARGFTWIKDKISGFNMAAKGMPYLVLVDLDTCECAPLLVREWLPVPKHPNLLFRIAVREVESWLLACKQQFSRLLGIEEALIPQNVDEIENAKECLIKLARKSQYKRIREDLVPEEGSTARVGPDYNGRLIDFVEKNWDPNIAKCNSLSLQKTISALDEFKPIFDN